MSVAADKAAYAAYLAAQSDAGPTAWADAAARFLSEAAAISVVHPVNELRGAAAYDAGVVQPLAAAFDGLHRRTDIVMGGRFEGAVWVSGMGYFAGHFHQPLFGIAPTGQLAGLRWGEFHRVSAGRAVESYVFLDLPELMMAAGQWPVAPPSGYSGPLPGPLAGDGLAIAADPDAGARSCEIVTRMLRELNTPDESWRDSWHPQMLWYGPAAFGAYLGIERFAEFQRPFELSFEGWAGGAAGNGRTAHFMRFGDGAYACSGAGRRFPACPSAPFLASRPTGR